MTTYPQSAKAHATSAHTGSTAWVQFWNARDGRTTIRAVGPDGDVLLDISDADRQRIAAHLAAGPETWPAAGEAP